MSNDTTPAKRTTDMYARMGVIWVFMMGVIFGGVLVAGFLFMKKFSEGIFPMTRVEESSQQVRELIEKHRVEMPANAYDLRYFLYAGKDYACWIAYSADPEDIEPILAKVAARPVNGPQYNHRPQKPEYWEPESTAGDWWPTSDAGLTVYAGQFYWLGYDPEIGRVYYYSFSM